MPFLSPTLSFTRYMIKDPLPDNFWATAIDQIGSKVFRENSAGVQEMSTGWVAPRDPFRDTITIEDISFSDYLVLSLRIDKRSVPSALVKKFCAIEEKRTIAERNLERITGKMRKEIRERVRLELLSKALPVPATYDLCWNIATGKLYFFCRQDKICGIFEELFKVTFELRPYPVIPYTLGLQLVDRENMALTFKEMKPEVFV